LCGVETAAIRNRVVVDDSLSERTVGEEGNANDEE